MTLYEYAVVYNPAKKEEKEGKKAKIVVLPSAVMAKDEETAKVHAIRQVPAEEYDDTDRLEVFVRPFVETP